MQSCSFICGEDYKGKKLGVPTHADTPCCNECILLLLLIFSIDDVFYFKAFTINT